MRGEFTIRLYVETDEKPVKDGKVSEDCIATMGKLQITLEEGDVIPEFLDPKKTKFLVNEVYDRLPSNVDGTDGRVLRDMIIEIGGRLSLSLFEGDKLMLLPVEGFAKTLIAGVGNLVRKGDPFAAVTTRKGEVHYLKPPEDSIVVFIDEITRAPNYVYYMLPLSTLNASNAKA